MTASTMPTMTGRTGASAEAKTWDDLLAQLAAGLIELRVTMSMAASMSGSVL